MFDVHLWWPKFAKEIIKLTDPISLEVKNEFRRHWVEKGGHIRDVLRDDIQLIVILEKILPRYWGPYPRTPLYRGENVERLEKGLLGLNWSSSVNIAREFASGLNADTHKGGVLLRVFPEMSSIVSGPYPYFYTARKEEEFILSPKCASKRLVELEYFPCVGC
ncbi:MULTISPECIES: hypothetical protein [unclassified Saccharibacter]|uniref:hypothetical protein n=1 Tax=unclassified Saccharibacter TaxID=2648722 RepID=UPI0013241602|nr:MULTISPECIES: hypothetical protein [unclassified Saccharibacter]MXV35813.1 hypothetical protein [Saccharibacter sp. EH611]MXV57934.1 hypothetical protein [Saccharibacter sp. EH70]MXV66329.1 hypothetical protein [Saccharibacter sp. EH60]